MLLAALLLPLGAWAQDYQQAPMLAEQVQAGNLPPLQERLPQDVDVVKPVERVGKYGGEIRRGLRGSNDHNNILRFIGPQGLTRWNPQMTGVVPNIARSYEVNDDATEFTFHLRRGMKWSDGEPMDAEDLAFNYELIVNQEFHPGTPAFYVVAGETMGFEQIDRYTVKYSFAAPYADFLLQMSTPIAQHPILYPKHYCSQFMPKYNPNIQQLLDENQVGDWTTLFRNKCGDIEIPARWGNADKPTLDPWIPKEPYTGSATRVMFERNPYFWQVDTEGNQLPYVDRIVWSVAQDPESLILDAINGQIDMQSRHLDGLQNRPVLAENREKGGYEFYRLRNVGQAAAIFFNQTVQDDTLREYFTQKDFRQAMSQAIDREEIIEIVYLGVGEPWQIGPVEDTPWYNEQLAKQYTEYDPELANKLLDGLGLDERDGDGFRLFPNGERVFFTLDVIPTYAPEWPDVAELLKQYWAAVGVDVKINTLERSIMYERNAANEHQTNIWEAGGSYPMLNPWWYVPIHEIGARFGPAWYDWWASDGKQGIEPPAYVQRKLELYDTLKRTASDERRNELFREMLQVEADNFTFMGITQQADRFGIKKTNLRNVPESMPREWLYPTPAPTLPAQYFWE